MEIIGVRFRKVGKIYYFDPKGKQIPTGTPIIVETVRGIEYGTVALDNRDVPEPETPVKGIIRIATEADTRQEENNRQKEKSAVGTCTDLIKQHNLDMRLVDVEVTFDLNKIIFYFTAEGRVDFRELVKSLASVFRMRIELRQIGVRDEAKIINGMGICGRTLCCATFLDEFQPVSIKMAKDQGMSLNPTKISGVCGRLMCCLKYEEETYEYLNKNLPNIGDWVLTPDGNGEILSVNVLRQLAKITVKKSKNDDPKVGSYPISDIKVLAHKPEPKAHCGSNCQSCYGCNSDEEKPKPINKPISKPVEKHTKSEKLEKFEKPEKLEKSEQKQRHHNKRKFNRGKKNGEKPGKNSPT